MTGPQTASSLKLFSLWNYKSWDSLPIPFLSLCQHLIPSPLAQSCGFIVTFSHLSFVISHDLSVASWHKVLSNLAWISKSIRALSLSSAFHFSVPLFFCCYYMDSFKNVINFWVSVFLLPLRNIMLSGFFLCLFFYFYFLVYMLLN